SGLTAARVIANAIKKQSVLSLIVVLLGTFPSSQRRGGCAEGADGVVRAANVSAELTTPARQLLLSCRASPPLRGGECLAHECRFRIIFAKVFLNFLIRNPLDGPASGPCPCIGSRIIDGHFVFQRVQVRTREALNKVKRFRMRQSSRGQPKLFIKADGVHDERIFLPVS